MYFTKKFLYLFFKKLKTSKKSYPKMCKKLQKSSSTNRKEFIPKLKIIELLFYHKALTINQKKHIF